MDLLCSVSFSLLSSSCAVSHNCLQGSLPLTYAPPAGAIYIDFSANPRMNGPLPSWVSIDSDTQTVAHGESFFCSTFILSTSPSAKLSIDAAYVNYQTCTCEQGTYGIPPECIPIPSKISLTLRPFQPYYQHTIDMINIDQQQQQQLPLLPPTLTDHASAPITSSSSTMNVTTTNSNSTSSSGNPNSNPHPPQAPTPSPSAAAVATFSNWFTDNTYGSQRYSSGMLTNWVINRWAESDSPELVRVIYFTVYISVAGFNSPTDFLQIYEGDEKLQGKRVFSFHSDDLTADILATATESSSLATVNVTSNSHNSSPSFTLSPFATTATASEITSSIASLGRYVEFTVPVFSPTATVNFQTRAASGVHFFLLYSFSTSCPATYSLDLSGSRCYPVTEANEGVRSAVYAIAATVLVILVIVGIYTMALNGGTKLVRASSRPFMSVLLLSLITLAAGGILFALIPSVDTAGDAICQLRVWLTAVGLSGILSVLVAKTARVARIFATKKLTVAKNVRDVHVAMMVIAILIPQLILLICFSAYGMSKGTLSLSTSSSSAELVRQCSQETGFSEWMIVEVAYLAMITVACAIVAFIVRDIPTAFNESVHMLNAVLMLLTFGCLLVPVDIFVSDNPEAAVVIQGIGQEFVTLALTIIIFGPKVNALTISRQHCMHTPL